VTTQTRQQARPRTPTQQVLVEVRQERDAQNERWGEQNHPSGGGRAPEKAYAYYAQRAADWKAINDARVANGTLGFDSILLEEVYEALAEEDPAKRRAELIQVAAVAVCEVEAIDRRSQA